MDVVQGLLIVLLLGLLIWAVCGRCRSRDRFGLEDRNYALAAMEQTDAATFLKGDLAPGYGMPPSLDTAEDVLGDVQNLPGEPVYESQAGIGLPQPRGIGYADPAESNVVEPMTFFPEVNTRQWSYYHYNFPFQYSDGTDPYPDNLYTRMRYIQPYEVANLSWSTRPGIYFPKALRNRWLRRGGSYYTINNGNEHDRYYDGW